jgi:hypothetical protein
MKMRISAARIDMSASNMCQTIEDSDLSTANKQQITTVKLQLQPIVVNPMATQ